MFLSKYNIVLFAIMLFIFLISPVAGDYRLSLGDIAYHRIRQIFNGTDVVSPGNVYWNVTKEIEVPVAWFRLPSVNPPQSKIIYDFPVLAFDDAQNESAYTTMYVVPEYREESDFDIAIYWATNDANTGDVVWCANVTQTTPETGNLAGDNTVTSCVVDQAPGVQYMFQKTDVITFKGLGTSIDDQFSFRVFRGADLSADTYTGDANLVEATIYYNSNKAGES